MTEDERRTLVQIQLLAQAWMKCECQGGCTLCIDRIGEIEEKVLDLLHGETNAEERE